MSPHCARSFFRNAISAKSTRICPVPGIAAGAAVNTRIQRRNTLSASSGSRATCATATLRLVVRLTAWIVNSQLNFRLVICNLKVFGHYPIWVSEKLAEGRVACRWPALQGKPKGRNWNAGQRPGSGRMHSHGISTLTVAEMPVLVCGNSERIRYEAVLAKLCGVCPHPVSGGKTIRVRLKRGRNRQANAALYRAAVVRMRDLRRRSGRGREGGTRGA